jgi:hypothetical protein
MHRRLAPVKPLSTRPRFPTHFSSFRRHESTPSMRIPAMPATCPECGLDQVARVPRMPRASAALRVFVFAACASIAVIWVARSYVHTGFSSGTHVGQFVAGSVTPARLEEYASGKAESPGSLVNAVLATIQKPLYTLGDTKLFAAIGPPPNVRTTALTAGFPSQCMTRTHQEVFADATRGTSPVPITTDPAARPLGQYESATGFPTVQPRPRVALWGGAGGTLAFLPAPESTGGVLYTTWISIQGLATNLACVALLGIVLAFVWGRVRRNTSLRKRLLVSLVVALLAMGTGAALTTQRTTGFGYPQWTTMNQVGFPPGPVYWHQDPFVEIALTERDLLKLKGEPDADARVAQAILDIVPAPKDAGDVLAIWAVPETHVPPLGVAGTNANYWECSLGTVRRYDMDRHPLHGSGIVTGELRREVRFEHSTLSLAQPRGTSLYVYNLYIGAILALAFYVLAGSWLMLAVVRLGLGVRGRRRAARGRCSACGYDLR